MIRVCECRQLKVAPSGIFLPGTELLQSPFGTEFSMGSRSRPYRWSLRCHRRFLQSYSRFLQSYRDPWGGRAGADAAMPIVARLAKHHKTLLNIVKHHETHVKHHETLKTLWNIMKHSSFDATISSLDAETSARWRRRSCGVTGDIGAVSGNIDDCGVGVTPQMCNRVTNHGDMSTFSKPD